MRTTKIDYLGFRSKVHPQVIAETVGTMLGAERRVGLVDPRHGRRGYESGWSLAVDGMVVGQVDAGGAHQRGWASVQVSGKGCSWVIDWRCVQDSLHDIDAEARRVDIALDTFRGEVTHDAVVAAHAEGRFTNRGRKPNVRRIENWPREQGWTVEIGKRTSGVFFRGYEKGFEQANRLAAPGQVIEKIDGVPVRDWYRCELELKAADGPLPLDLIERRDEYFAGAYPFLRDLVDSQPFQLSQPRERGPQQDLSAYLACIRAQYGRGLFTALVAHRGDIGAVWSKIVGTEHSRSLIEAGVLLVEHEEPAVQ